MAVIGQLSLYCALLFALVQASLPCWGVYRNQPYFLATSRPAALGQFICLVLAYIVLTIAFYQDHFAISYVVLNSHPDLPLFYKLTAIWGSHEGSILFWVVVLNIWTQAFIIIYSNKRTPFYALVIGLFGFLSVCFLCFLIFTSNPFTLNTQHLFPQDLNPLLQDPGFVIHPPLLYIGYVGFSAAFVITLASLINNKMDKEWIDLTYSFSIVAWAFLTLGIMLGSWWAYRVLGWGGFWFWDPVENASLLPWLSGTALIHLLVLCKKRNTAKTWTVFFALLSFMMSMLGTFLVRSGLLISAHTFAADPSRGIFLLILLSLFLLATTFLFIMRLPQLKNNSIEIKLISRETGLLLNSALFFLALLTLLLGTLYPLILDTFHLGTISIGAPYFNQAMLPILFITLLLMAIIPFCHWQEQSIKQLILPLAKIFFLSAIVALMIILNLQPSKPFLIFITLTLCLAIIIGMMKFFRLKLGMTLAHSGFAILIIGILLSSFLSEERFVKINQGEIINIGPYQFLFINTKFIKGSNYNSIRGAFEITKKEKHIANLYPEKRFYLVREMVMTKVAIHPGIFRDLYLALGDPLDNNAWSVRVYYKPFVRWIWFGGILIALGGFFGLMKRNIK